MSLRMLLGTRKGLVVFTRGPEGWRITGVHHLGNPVSYAVEDPRDGAWWAALDHGHWGQKLHRSRDQGRSWEEVKAPAYPEDATRGDGVPRSRPSNARSTRATSSECAIPPAAATTTRSPV